MPDATKYPPSTHRVRVRQVSESKSLVGSRSRDYGCCRIFPSSPAPCLNCGGGDRWCRSPTCFGLWQLSFLPFEKDTTTTTEVENAKKAQKKVPSDYWLLEHYDILKVQGDSSVPGAPYRVFHRLQVIAVCADSGVKPELIGERRDLLYFLTKAGSALVPVMVVCWSEGGQENACSQTVFGLDTLVLYLESWSWEQFPMIAGALWCLSQSTLNANLFVSLVIQPIVLPFMIIIQGGVFQLDNACPHIVVVKQRVLQSVDMLP
ncbi:phospholipid-transporting ATPase [Trichonephila clavipes]|nr:phospholipid-transporting ATPase [Trichonephila clavipes]